MTTSLPLNLHYDELIVSLEQMSALLDVITSADLTDLKLASIASYFWIMCDIMDKAKAHCDNLENLIIDSPVLGKENHAN